MPSDLWLDLVTGVLGGEKGIQSGYFGYLFSCRENILPTRFSWVGCDPQTKFTVPVKLACSVCLSSDFSNGFFLCY